jgi:hypothetical protein
MVKLPEGSIWAEPVVSVRQSGTCLEADKYDWSVGEKRDRVMRLSGGKH